VWRRDGKVGAMSNKPSVDTDVPPETPGEGQTEPAARVKRRRSPGIPRWGWVLGAVALVGVLLLWLDLRNADRFLLVCDAGVAEVHQGWQFPWPLGHEPMTSPGLDPVKLIRPGLCHPREFEGQLPAEAALLDLIIRQVRAVLATPGQDKLEAARRQVEQATVLVATHQARRATVRGLLAEVSYRQARLGLSLVEDELRLALARFRQARKLGGDRFVALAAWETHLEALIKAISPRPPSDALPVGVTPAPLRPTPLTPEHPGHDARPLPLKEKTPDARAPVPSPPDAARPEISGILM